MAELLEPKLGDTPQEKLFGFFGLGGAGKSPQDKMMELLSLSETKKIQDLLSILLFPENGEDSDDLTTQMRALGFPGFKKSYVLLAEFIHEAMKKWYVRSWEQQGRVKPINVPDGYLVQLSQQDWEQWSVYGERPKLLVTIVNSKPYGNHRRSGASQFRLN